MRRRAFLKTLAGTVASTYIVAWPALLRRVEAASSLPLTALQFTNANDGVILVPSDAQFATYQIAFNKRMMIEPQARILCKTPEGVATAVKWVQEYKVPFALRAGGHSYEGFSQSAGVVIDTQLMSKVEMEKSGGIVSVGGGSSLGHVYSAIGTQNLAIPAGSCPPVGVAGHTQGGGFGLLGRPLGLACDSLLSADIVTASGEVRASANENSDLFWAIRGGGGGSFGAVTGFRFQTHLVGGIVVFGVTWTLPPERALKVMQAWQSALPQLPHEVTCIFVVTHSSGNSITLHCAGQSTGSESELNSALAPLMVEKPSSFPTPKMLSFLQAVQHFGGAPGYTSTYMKGRSDYLYQPMSAEGILALFNGLLALPAGAVAVICDGYGGKIAEVAPDATAFAHRKALYVIQYYSEWSRASQSERHVAMSRQLYQAMRPYVSGYCYVNYPDLELKTDYAHAYWGDNLARLMRIKTAVDPQNLFRHAQSIPLS